MAEVEIGRSRNWPKSKLAEIEIGRSRNWPKSKLAEVDHDQPNLGIRVKQSIVAYGTPVDPDATVGPQLPRQNAMQLASALRLRCDVDVIVENEEVFVSKKWDWTERRALQRHEKITLLTSFALADLVGVSRIVFPQLG